MSKSCKKCFVSKSVSKSVLHNSCIITVSKKCPSWALFKLGPNLTCGFDYFKDGVLSLFEKSCYTILFSMWGPKQTT